MKASEFKQLIKEAVKEALKEELLEIVSPTVTSKEPQVGPPPPPVKQAAPFAGNNPLMEVLNMTSRTMSADDYRNIMQADSSMANMFDRNSFKPQPAHIPGSEVAIKSAPKVGLDLSNLSFVKNAAAIVKASDQKDKIKHGL